MYKNRKNKSRKKNYSKKKSKSTPCRNLTQFECLPPCSWATPEKASIKPYCTGNSIPNNLTLDELYELQKPYRKTSSRILSTRTYKS